MATHNETSKWKEVLTSNSFPNHLFRLDKHELIKMILETQNNLEKRTATRLQIEKDLKASNDVVSYLNSFRSDVQTRFFDLLDQNVMLKEREILPGKHQV